ncbi:MAG: hypothetical protein Q4E65_05925 [Clostridia bacterium]|nr:hypothetical protein [Clostridia bacterium]
MADRTASEQIARDNRRILALLRQYLVYRPTFIQKDMLDALCESGVGRETAYALLLASAMGLDMDAPSDKAFYHAYFPAMLHHLRPADYMQNPYYRAIRLPEAQSGGITLRYDAYAGFEAFVCDDILSLPDGRQIPQIGYFNEAFPYPAILENGRLWMSVTPNEINTMADVIAQAKGRVLTFGLGLGYFAYMASLRPEVTRVTVVEQNPSVIALFQAHILPQFSQGGKLNIVQDDAFAYAQAHYPKEEHDFIFTDLWHDAGDGLPLYTRMKQLEALAPAAVHAYWIEKTMACYL